MIITAHAQCTTPEGDVADICFNPIAPLAFVPAIGMCLKLTREGDFMRVKDVYWDCTEPWVLHVYLTVFAVALDETRMAPMLPKQDVMTSEGWRLE